MDRIYYCNQIDLLVYDDGMKSKTKLEHCEEIKENMYQHWERVAIRLIAAGVEESSPEFAELVEAIGTYTEAVSAYEKACENDDVE